MNDRRRVRDVPAERDFTDAELTSLYRNAEMHFNAGDPGPYAEVMDLIGELRTVRKRLPEKFHDR